MQRTSGRSTRLILAAAIGIVAALGTSAIALGAPATHVTTVTKKLTVTTKKLPAGSLGVKYKKKLTEAHGHGLEHWSAKGLPKGITLSHKGVLSGVPKVAGKHTITVKVTDSKHHHATRKLVLLIHNPAVAISVGNSGGQTFACALTKARALQCWGANDSDEVGTAVSSIIKSPHTVPGFSKGTKSVATGASFACAVDSAGAAKCWGRDTEGQLGDGVNDLDRTRATPVTVHGLSSGVKSVSTSKDEPQACALMTSGAVDCWGDNIDGQLGTNGPVASSAVPVAITGLPSNVASVDVGAQTICALTTTGDVWCWGTNEGGQLGTGTTGGISATPVEVTGLGSGVKSIALGEESLCAVTSGGTMLCWGDIDNDTTSNHPVAVSGMPGSEAAVTVGTYGATCALSKVGGVRCFGYNYDGTLGNGTDTNSNTPVHVKGISTGATAISLAEYTGCALLKGGSIKCWGYVPTGNGLSLSPVTLPWYA